MLLILAEGVNDILQYLGIFIYGHPSVSEDFGDKHPNLLSVPVERLCLILSNSCRTIVLRDISLTPLIVVHYGESIARRGEETGGGGK